MLHRVFQLCGLSVSTHVESVFTAFTLFMYVPGTVMFLPIFHIILLSAVSQCLNEVMSIQKMIRQHNSFYYYINLFI